MRNRWPWWLLRMALSITVVLQLWVQWQHRKLLCLKISSQNTALQPVHIEMITWKLRHLSSFSCCLQSFKEIWEQRSRQHILIKSICAHQYLSHTPSASFHCLLHSGHHDYVVYGQDRVLQGTDRFLCFPFTCRISVFECYLFHMEDQIRDTFWNIFLKVTMCVYVCGCVRIHT